MKAWIISDLHIGHHEVHSAPFSIPDADVCICAGDTAGNVELSLEFLSTRIEPYMPVVTVLGNHDYYGNSIDKALSDARKLTQGTDLTLLENDTVVLNGVRIIGATLWTDYDIPHGGTGPQLPVQARKQVAIQVCQRYMLDFREIWASKSYATEPGAVSPDELIARHLESRSNIDTVLSQPFDGISLVVTHHAPLPRSLHPDFLGHPSNGGFASDLGELIKTRQPDYWVHGHIHMFFDYMQHETRVICNPRGYRREAGSSRFRPGFVVDL